MYVLHTDNLRSARAQTNDAEDMDDANSEDVGSATSVLAMDSALDSILSENWLPSDAVPPSLAQAMRTGSLRISPLPAEQFSIEVAQQCLAQMFDRKQVASVQERLADSGVR